MFTRRAVWPLLLIISCAPLSDTPRSGFPAALREARSLGPAAPSQEWSGRAEPLRVVHHSPTVEAEGLSAILVTFNQAMVPLGPDGNARPGGADAIRVEPPVAAVARWVAGDTLKLALTRPLQNARRYQVTVPATLRSLVGERLPAPFSWEFETPRPRLASLTLQPNHRDRFQRLLPDDRLLLAFNLAVEVEEVRRRLALRANGAPLSFLVERAENDPKKLVVWPPAGFPAHAKVQLEVAAGFRSSEGPLPSSKSATHRFETRRPLSLEIRCDGDSVTEAERCWPMRQGSSGLMLSFSEPVERDELVRALRIEPHADLARHLKPSVDFCGGDRAKRRCGREYELAEHLLPRRNYRVRVDTSLRDVFGQRLGQAEEVRFATRDFPPGLFLAPGTGVRETWHPFALKAINIKKLEVRVRRQEGSALVRFLECRERSEESEGAERCIVGPTPPPQVQWFTGRTNQMMERKLPLPRGLVVVTLQSPEIVDPEQHPVLFRRIVQHTELGLQARLTAFGVVAWVTSLRTGKPVAGSQVAVYDRKGNLLAEAKTGSGGIAEVKRSALGSLLDGKVLEPLLPRSGRLHRWWRRERRVAPPQLYVLASVGQGNGRDEAHLLLGDEQASSTTSLAEELWRKRWAAHDAERDDSEEPKERAELEPVELASYDSWEGEREQLAGYVSTERGIYRPGHIVYVQGALRRYRSWKGEPAQGAKASVRLMGTENEIVREQAVELSRFGVFRASLPLPTTGRLGYHRILLVAGGMVIASHAFKVAEYREPPFEVKLSSKPREEIQQGAELLAQLQANYLFGGPVDGVAYRLSVTRTPHSFSPGGLGNYQVGASSWEVGEKEATWLRREGALDASGRAQVSIATGGNPFPWPCSQMIEAEVSSVDRQSVATRHYLNQHPGDFYVAYANAPSEEGKAKRKLLVVTPQGKPVGGRRVRASLHPQDRSGYGRVDLKRTLWSTNLLVPQGGTTLDIPWPDREQYRLYLLLSVTDGSGREARSLSALDRPDAWVRKEELREEATKERAAKLTIKLDRQNYLPGQEAIVTVNRRGGTGQGMLFVERERLFRSLPLRFDARGRAQVRIPVEDRFASSVEIRAVITRRGAELRGTDGPLLSAVTNLIVSEKPYRLDVALSTERKRYRPGERVRVSLVVADGLRRPRQAEVVVMAVDEAVLQLTHYELPDPLRDLLRTPAASVLADDVRRHLAELGIVVVHQAHADESFGLGGFGMTGRGAGGGSGSGYGGGSGGLRRRDDKPRRRFLTTAWHASLVTNEAGRAEASFVLPDNLTRYRLMALAVDAARSSGTGQSEIEVDLPLVTLPALPRLLRVGDQAQAGVVVHNARLPAGTVKVRARVEGDALALVGSDTQEVKLAQGQQREVRFGLRGRRVGEGKITLQVEMGRAEIRDTLEHRLSVKQAVLPEAASISGETQGAVRQGLAPLQRLLPEHGGLEVSLASTALTGVEDGMEQLIDYPYGCLEQKSSRLLPMLAAMALGERFSLKLPGQPRALIRMGVSDVLAMQRSDGGFGYWPGSSLSWPWATAYALIVLARARLVENQTGVRVADESVRRAVVFLRPFTRPACRPSQKSGCSPDLGPWEFAYRSFIIYALALHGEEISSPALELFGRRGHEPLFARAMLLAALAIAKGKEKDKVRSAMARLAGELGDSLRVEGTWAHAEENLHDGYKVMMHSSDRTTAMVLLALLQAQPQHPMVPRLVRWFLLGRKQARFRNTQEAAWALLALWDYARIREKEVPDFEAGVWLGGQRLVNASFRGHSVKPVLARRQMLELLRATRGAAQDLIIGKRGAGTLYYVARLRYARKDLPVQSRDHGLSVRRQVEVLDKAGRPLNQQRPPKLGDTLRITLEVLSNEARRYVVVEDPLPAGLEALDVALATGARTFGGLDSWLQSSAWDHRELRDDRVLFFRDLMQPGKLVFRYLARVSFAGEFLAPPLRAEEMYTPEVYGHGAAGRVRYPER